MITTLSTRLGTVRRIGVVAIAVLSPMAAIVASHPGYSTAGHSWNAPMRGVVAAGTAKPAGHSWN
jgi:hypothetical protein